MYLGFDPALDRRLAIELLHPRLGASTAAPDGRARLLREGQAMARLTERSDRIEALLQTHAYVTLAIVEDAISLAQRLDGIDACADTEQVRNRIQLPEDPLVRARVGELRGDLERARAMLQAMDEVPSRRVGELSGWLTERSG